MSPRRRSIQFAVKCHVSSAVVLLCAGVSTGQEHAAPSVASQPSTPTTRHRASLQDAGLVVAVVDDTLGERVLRATGGRTDQPTTHERRAYEREHSDEALELLRSLGVNMLIVPFGGHGPPEYEANERTLAKSFLRRAQAQGFLVGYWLPLGYVNPATWKESEVAIDDWLAKSANGNPLSVDAIGGCRVDRYAPDYVRHADALAGEAAREPRPDAIVIRDFTVSGGYGPDAQAAFRKWVHRHRGGMGRTTEADDVDTASLAIPKPNDADARLMESWMAFRADRLMDRLDALRRIIHGIDPGIAVGVGVPIRPFDPARGAGPCFDLAELSKRGVLISDEMTVYVDNRKHVLHQIPAIKALSDAGCRVISRAVRPIDVAQSMAFGRNTAGRIASFSYGHITAESITHTPVDSQTVAMAQFLRKHPEWFADVHRAVDFVLFRPSVIAAGRPPADATLYAQTAGALVT
ncbi:MAG: hypothetical protein V3T70_03450, partial [Phycisphaerae bacterium]